MKIGYVRVSTEEQNTARQEDIMATLGVEEVYIDKMSGKNTDRPQLNAMMQFIRRGDVVIVESISRLARSAKDLLNLVAEFDEKGVKFISQKENIDTDTPSGRFMITIFAAVSQLERENIKLRQREGIRLAKERGVYVNPKKITVDEELFEKEYKKWMSGKQTATQTQKNLGIKPCTFYRRVNEFEKERGIVVEREQVGLRDRNGVCVPKKKTDRQRV